MSVKKNELKSVEKKNVVVKADEKEEIGKFTAQDKRTFKSLENAISREFKNVEKSSLNIAFLIHDVYHSKLYQIGGYRNIYEFAQREFNIARGTCSNFINIVNNFAERDETGKYKHELKESFRLYSFSKLIVLLGVPDSKLHLFMPHMTVSEIKTLKKTFEAVELSEGDYKVLDSYKEENTTCASAEKPKDTFLNEPINEKEYMVVSFPDLDKFQADCKMNTKLLEVLKETFEDMKIATGKVPSIEIRLHV